MKAFSEKHLSQTEGFGTLKWFRPAVLLILLCCLGLMQPAKALQAATVVAGGQDAAILASKLQLEGTQMQLKGNIEGAVEKYRQSLALKPNPKLESLVRRLEQHAARVNSSAGSGGETASSKKAVAAEATAAISQQKAAAETAMAQETAGSREQEAEEPVPVVHHPASAREALVYDFVDWTLGILTGLTEGKELRLETNRDYKVIPDGEGFEVHLNPFLLHIKERSTMTINPLVFRCRPQGAELLDVELVLPEKIPFSKSGKEVFSLTTAHRQISGLWDRSMKEFQHADLNLDDIALRDNEGVGQLTVRSMALAFALTEQPNGEWKQAFTGSLEKPALQVEDFLVQLDGITLSSALKGSDFAAYRELRKQYLQLLDNPEHLQLADIKKLLPSADKYIELLSSYDSNVTAKSIRVQDSTLAMQMNSLKMTGSMVKDPENKGFNMQGKGTASGLSYHKQADENTPQPVSVTVREVQLNDTFRINPVPAGFFSDMGDVIEKLEAMEDKEKQDQYLADEALKFSKQFLSLIGGGSTEFLLSDVTVKNIVPEPVSLAELRLGSGFDTGTGNGGTIRLLAGFSGINGMDQLQSDFPQAANLHLELAGIPSLLDLFNDSEALAKGNPQQIQGQVMMNGMGKLMSSPMVLSLIDSFITFPASRLDMNLTAKVDNQASLLSTGSLQMTIENPDDFMRIAKELSPDPNIQQMLATVTALANRTDANGKVVDTIDASLTPEGKILVNSKDVTAMFMPQKASRHNGEKPGTETPENQEDGRHEVQPVPSGPETGIPEPVQAVE